MPLILVDGPSLGTAGRDLMVDLPGGLADSIMRGDSGNDILFGDWDAIVDNGRGDGNVSIATALSLDDPALWAAGINHFMNLNGPHATVYLEPGAGQRRFFELNLTAGQSIMAESWAFTFTGPEIQNRGGLRIEVLGADGSVLKDISSQTIFVIPTDGVYYLRIGESSSTSPEFEGDEAWLATFRVVGQEAAAPVASPGRDMLYGGPGDDILFGFGGNDTLRGNPGNDHMYGGRGNDTYYVEQALDIVHEYAGEGSDTVLASSDFYMYYAEIETVRLMATDLYVSGNGAATTFHGSDGHDFVDAGAGNDVLIGNGGSDTLRGDEGSDILIGGLGLDSLTGGSGADIFRFLDFTDLRDPANPQARERIWDFNASQGDRIDLSAIDAIPGGADDAFIFLGRSPFTGRPGEIRLTSGETMPVLRIDFDGDGRADAIVELYLYSFNPAVVAEIGAAIIL